MGYIRASVERAWVDGILDKLSGDQMVGVRELYNLPAFKAICHAFCARRIDC